MTEMDLLRIIAGWLNDLSVLTAGRMSLEEARERMSAYSVLLADDFDATAFTRKSLAAVAKEIRWFPSFGDLHAALDGFTGREAFAQHDAEHNPISANRRLTNGH